VRALDAQNLGVDERCPQSKADLESPLCRQREPQGVSLTATTGCTYWTFKSTRMVGHAPPRAIQRTRLQRGLR
jgi:hypothetical protein